VRRLCRRFSQCSHAINPAFLSRPEGLVAARRRVGGLVAARPSPPRSSRQIRNRTPRPILHPNEKNKTAPSCAPQQGGRFGSSSTNSTSKLPANSKPHASPYPSPQRKKQNRVPHPALLSRVEGFVAARPTPPRSSPQIRNRIPRPILHPNKTKPGAPSCAPQQGGRFGSSSTKSASKLPANSKPHASLHPSPQQKKTKPGAPSCAPQQGGRFCSSSTRNPFPTGSVLSLLAFLRVPGVKSFASPFCSRVPTSLSRRSSPKPSSPA
jgi:hypothetical protein